MQEGEFFKGIGDEELSCILLWCDRKTLARCTAVSKQWNRVARSDSMQIKKFLNAWKPSRLDGEPKSPIFFQAAGLSSFVYRHEVLMTDTMPSLAVKYGCNVLDIKMINGISSDHGLMSRRHVFVPVRSCKEVAGNPCAIQYCKEAKRELIVVKVEAPKLEKDSETLKSPTGVIQLGMPVVADGHALDNGRRRVAELLSNELFMDVPAALFYLGESGWDVDKAKELFRQDTDFVVSELDAGRSVPS